MINIIIIVKVNTKSHILGVKYYFIIIIIIIIL